MGGWLGGKMNSRIRLTSAKVEVGVEVEAELGKNYLGLPKILILYNDFTLKSLWSIQLILKIKELKEFI